MSRIVSAQRVATLVGDFPRSPAYLGLAESLRVLIGDGRIGIGVRLPSERDLTAALDVSRTTVTRAYEVLRESGYAEARRGSGTFTTRAGRAAPRPRPVADAGHRRRGRHRPQLRGALRTARPRRGLPARHRASCPPTSADPATSRSGCPPLQAGSRRPTTHAGCRPCPSRSWSPPARWRRRRWWRRRFTGSRRAGRRRVADLPQRDPGACATRGARLVAAAVDPDGWDLDALAATLRQTSPRLAYLIPDFQNPTGHLMSDSQREELAHALARTRTTVVADEAHQALALAPGLADDMPRPLAAHAHDAITIGSASKSFWGGLRLGWVRAPLDRHGPAARRPGIGLDLGAPVFEQLVLADLLDRADEVLPGPPRAAASRGRDALVAAVREHLPAWRFRVPDGGLALWCELPEALGTALDGRGRAARRRRRARAGLRRRGRPRPVRADPLDPPRRRAHRGRRRLAARGTRDRATQPGRQRAGAAGRVMVA